MIRNKLGSVLAIVGIVLTATAAIYLATLPDAVSHITCTGPPSHCVYSNSSLIESDGYGILAVLLFPVAISAAGLFASRNPAAGGKVGLGVTAIVLAGFCFVFLFTYGLYYIPAALTLLVGAILHATLARPLPS